MDDTKLLRGWVLGGDGRYPWAVTALRNSGLPVKTWGVPGMQDDAPHLEDALRGANLVLLPMRPFQGEQLEIGGETAVAALLPHMLGAGAILIAGSFPTDTEAWLQSQGIFCVSFLELETYQMANAAVTAEGAVFLTMEHMNKALCGAEILVIGWGRIGHFLAEKLKALGANVTVSARREGQKAEIALMGYRPEETGVYAHGLGTYDAVINTVPSPVFGEIQGRQLQRDCVCIELASLPGGFSLTNRTVIMGQGLPGKTAPQSAGENLAEAVWSCLKGEGRTLE